MANNKTCPSTVKSTGKPCSKKTLKNYNTCYSHLSGDARKEYKESKGIKSTKELNEEIKNLKKEIEILNDVIKNLSIKA